MPYDAQHFLEHPEVAGWALGALDSDDVAVFEEHLQTCEQCQVEAAEFAPVAEGLKLAVPAVEPPDDLELKVVAAVQYAVMAASRAEAEPVSATAAVVSPKPKLSSVNTASRWWHLHWTSRFTPLATAMGAAAITAAAFIGVQLFGLTAPALAATISLHAMHGASGSGQAVVRHANGGWEIQLTVKHLPKLSTGQFYECWYADPGSNRPGHPELITAGTFASSDATVHMWSAANPAKFTIMQITIEQPGDASQHGQVILQGKAQPT
jgi:hypothetical protein